MSDNTSESLPGQRRGFRTAELIQSGLSRFFVDLREVEHTTVCWRIWDKPEATEGNGERDYAVEDE
jgi:hypothetical protein